MSFQKCHVVSEKLTHVTVKRRTSSQHVKGEQLSLGNDCYRDKQTNLQKWLWCEKRTDSPKMSRVLECSRVYMYCRVTFSFSASLSRGIRLYCSWTRILVPILEPIPGSVLQHAMYLIQKTQF